MIRRDIFCILYAIAHLLRWLLSVYPRTAHTLYREGRITRAEWKYLRGMGL